MLVPELMSSVQGALVPIRVDQYLYTCASEARELTSGLDTVYEPVASLAFSLASTNNVGVDHRNGIGAAGGNVRRVVDRGQRDYGLGLHV